MCGHLDIGSCHASPGTSNTWRVRHRHHILPARLPTTRQGFHQIQHHQHLLTDTCSCQRSKADFTSLETSKSQLLLPAGLCSIAALLLWSGPVSAAELSDKIHHLSSSSSMHIGDHLPKELFQLSSEEDFWGNVYAYIRYFFSVLLGTAYIAIKPIAGLFKRPVTAVFTVAGLVLLAVFVSTTVNAMLGMSDYVPFEPLSTMSNLEQ